MRVLLATEAYWPINDGGSVFERRLVRGLRERGHDLRVIAPSPTRSYTLDESDGYPIYRPASLPATFIPTYRFTYHPSSVIERIWPDFAPELVHIHNPYAIGRAALRLARRHGVPALATNHLMPENFFYNLGSSWIKTPLGVVSWRYLIGFHNRTDFVTSPSETAVRYLRDHGLRVPSQAVSNGVETNRFKPRPQKETSALRKKFKLPTAPVVLYMGRLDREKRMDIWVRAIPEVLKNTEAHFVIGGRGNDKARIENLVQELGISNHVTFPGFIEDDDLPLLYNLASLFAIASPAELQSIVTLEAIASGLPVVAVKAGALPELVKDGHNGRLTPEGGPVQFGQAIAEVLQSPRRDAYAEASRELALTHSNEKMLDHYLDIYEQLVGANQ